MQTDKARRRDRRTVAVGPLRINDQTVGDEVINPSGGAAASCNGTNTGESANWEVFTRWQWTIVKRLAPRYPL
jgi:benzaldehyde dehydrogenase (NAD)